MSRRPLFRRHSSPTDGDAASPPPPSRAPSGPVRDDCWSEDATFTLIKAWGDRYLHLNRGNLRQKHWREVADAVNARHAPTKKLRRTDIQCKNRIDTLKKKYKVEKSKALENAFDPYVSPWPFFQPLDSLIGSSFKPSSSSSSPPHRKRVLSPPPSVPVAPRSKRRNRSPDSCDFRRNFSAMAAAAAAIEAAEEDSDTSRSTGVGGGPRRSEADAYHELAAAIGRFAEVYERVEAAKQRQMVELETQRMQLTKDLELQRMKLLMESQIQLEKLKGSNTDFFRCNDGDDDGDGSASMS